MEEYSKGYEYLKKLREETGKAHQSFDDYTVFLENKARATGTPITGTFELTPLCNLACKMCYVHLEKEQLKGRKLLSVEQWKHLMGQAVEAGMLYAILSGGECLTYPGFDELYLYLQRRACETQVLTNGLLLDEKRIRFFQANRPNGGIQVTLYGGSEEVYERVTGRRVFGVVCDHVRKAVAAGLPIHLSITPNRFLGEDIYDTVRVAASLCSSVDINLTIIPPREDTGRSEQRDDVDTETYVRALTLLRELQGLKAAEIPEDQLPQAGGPSRECTVCGVQCGAGRSMFSANWLGKMRPCNRLDMIESDPFEDGFQKAWAQINERANSLPRVAECVGCPYEDCCSACAADFVRFAVPGKRPEPLCQRTIAFVRHGIRRLPGCE